MEDVDLDSARSEASAGLALVRRRGQRERRKRSQFAAVAKKNLVLIRRHWLGSTASQLLAPIVVMLILRMMQDGDSSSSRPDPNPAEREVSDVEPCGREGCAAILYAPRGVAWVDDLMDLVREQSGLEGEAVPVLTLQPLGPDEQAGAMWCLNNPGTPLPCPVQTWSPPRWASRSPFQTPSAPRLCSSKVTASALGDEGQPDDLGLHGRNPEGGERGRPPGGLLGPERHVGAGVPLRLRPVLQPDHRAVSLQGERPRA